MLTISNNYQPSLTLRLHIGVSQAIGFPPKHPILIIYSNNPNIFGVPYFDTHTHWPRGVLLWVILGKCAIHGVPRKVKRSQHYYHGELRLSHVVTDWWIYSKRRCECSTCIRHIYIHLHVCNYIFIHICTCKWLVPLYTYIYIYTFIYTYIYTYLYAQICQSPNYDSNHLCLAVVLQLPIL